MSHKVEIENILQDSKSKFENNKLFKSLFFELSQDITNFHDFIDKGCIDCANDNPIIIKREVFSTKINKVKESLTNVINTLTDLRDNYINLDDYWPVDITDTTGLTNPIIETTETTETTSPSGV